jgi:hypothetical protein
VVRLLVLLAAAPLAAPDPAPLARAHVVSGELVRLDLGRRSITVKATEAGAVREYEIDVPDAARLSSSGRVARLEDLRPGDRVVVSCSDPAPGRHVARSVKIGPSRYAVPVPKASPSAAKNPPGAVKP